MMKLAQDQYVREDKLTNVPPALVSHCSPCAYSTFLQVVGVLCPQTPSLIPLIYSVPQHTQGPLAPVCMYVCMYVSVHILLSNSYNSYSHMSIFQYFNIPIYINQSLLHHYIIFHSCPICPHRTCMSLPLHLQPSYHQNIIHIMSVHSEP